MDMVFNYLPDVFSYQSLRHYNYENPWLNEPTVPDNRPQNVHNKARRNSRDSCKDSKGSCPICQERQRRPLATYIRSKSMQDQKEDHSILEEESESEDVPQDNLNSSQEKKDDKNLTSLQRSQSCK